MRLAGAAPAPAQYKEVRTIIRSLDSRLARIAAATVCGIVVAIVVALIAGRDSPRRGAHSSLAAGDGGQALALLTEPGPESPQRVSTVFGPSPTEAARQKPALSAGLADEVGAASAGMGLARAAPQAESGDSRDGAGPGQGGDSADVRGLESAQGKVYFWHDGDRKRRVRVQTDLAVVADGVIKSRADVVPRSELGADQAGAGDGRPVFRGEASKTLMALPGGVVLALDPDWDSSQVSMFFAGNKIKVSRVSDLGWLTNGYFVETGPGFPSLELANWLATQDGVELSSPNWWTDATTK